MGIKDNAKQGRETMSRIELTDSIMDMVMKMVEGNPGAVSAIMDLMEKSEKIDPQSVWGNIGTILSLDTHEIYGSAIYVLWSDKCNRDARKMCVLLRAVQLGFLPESKLKEMAADQMREVDLTAEGWEDIDSKVCEQLEEFQRPA